MWMKNKVFGSGRSAASAVDLLLDIARFSVISNSRLPTNTHKPDLEMRLYKKLQKKRGSHDSKTYWASIWSQAESRLGEDTCLEIEHAVLIRVFDFQKVLEHRHDHGNFFEHFLVSAGISIAFQNLFLAITGFLGRDLGRLPRNLSRSGMSFTHSPDAEETHLYKSLQRCQHPSSKTEIAAALDILYRRVESMERSEVRTADSLQPSLSCMTRFCV